MVQSFFSMVKPGRHGPDAPPLAPASARSRSAPRARRAARAGHGWVRGGVVRGCVREREARIVRSRPPSLKPAARPEPAGPSGGPALSGNRCGGGWVEFGGAGGLGSKRLDPGALRLLGRLSPAGQGLPWSAPRLPLPLITNVTYLRLGCCGISSMSRLPRPALAIPAPVIPCGRH